jgi:ACS family phthalate transporter-like MFS transporter
LAEERGRRQPGGHQHFLGALKDRKVWFIVLAYCLTIMSTGNVTNIWAPSIIRDSGITSLSQLGLLSALPYVIAVGVMLLVCRHSDQQQERRWHFTVPGLLAALAMLILPQCLSSPTATVATMVLMTTGYLSATAGFWTIPTYYLSDRQKRRVSHGQLLRANQQPADPDHDRPDQKPPPATSFAWPSISWRPWSPAEP